MKALIQVKEVIEVGEKYYSQIAGNMEVVDESVLIDTAFGILITKVDNVAYCLLLADDFDLSSLDETVLVLN